MTSSDVLYVGSLSQETLTVHILAKIFYQGQPKGYYGELMGDYLTDRILHPVKKEGSFVSELMTKKDIDREISRGRIEEVTTYDWRMGDDGLAHKVPIGTEFVRKK